MCSFRFGGGGGANARSSVPLQNIRGWHCHYIATLLRRAWKLLTFPFDSIHVGINNFPGAWWFLLLTHSRPSRILCYLLSLGHHFSLFFRWKNTMTHSNLRQSRTERKCNTCELAHTKHFTALAWQRWQIESESSSSLAVAATVAAAAGFKNAKNVNEARMLIAECWCWVTACAYCLRLCVCVMEPERPWGVCARRSGSFCMLVGLLVPHSHLFYSIWFF